MTDEELREIKDRADAATPGPWDYMDGYVIKDETVLCEMFTDNPVYGDSRNDTTFIAHARTDIPRLIAEVERLRDFATECQGYAAKVQKIRSLKAREAVAEELIRELYSGVDTTKILDFKLS